MKAICTPRLFAISFSLACLLAAPVLQAQDGALNVPAVDKERPVAAIFVANRAGAVFDGKVKVVEDYLTGRLAERGFTVMSKDVVMDSLRVFSGNSQLPLTTLEERLRDSTSALRLAQNMGADVLVIGSITGYGHERKRYNSRRLGVRQELDVHRLRLSYRIASALNGGAVAGDTVSVSHVLRETDELSVATDDITNTLLQEAGELLNESLSRTLSTGLVVDARDPGTAEVAISARIADLTVPEIVRQENGDYIVTKNREPVVATDVAVEIDGLMVGSTGPDSQFTLRRGPSQLRLRRDGYETLEAFINPVDGQTYNLTLVPSQEEHRRIREQLKLLEGLKAEQKLTDAQVEMLRGLAETFRQSGIRVDTKEGLTPIINQQSLLPSLFPFPGKERRETQD